ncbi:MAG: glycosyltransferase family 4 protein [Thomasclavelia spiroformis]|uniref:glycosyltransferase family 4 protein n=1 Tax=Thomasclavelia spiroformis TaxID=29348 RepID=UPI003990B441
MKVLFLTNIPSPYRVDFFNELGKYCELTVLYERKKADDREWLSNKNINFKAIFLKGIKKGNDTALCFEVIKYLKKHYDHIIIGGYSTPTGMLAIEFLKFKKKKFILSCDGGFIRENESKINYKIKKHFISGANIYLSTGKVCSKYLEYYGARKEKIYFYPFTSVYKDEILKRTLNPIEKENLKKELGIKDKKIVIFVGQIIHRKGIDILLKAIKNVSGNIAFYIIGGQPTDEYKETIKKSDLDNIKFMDFMEKKLLFKYYQVSDLFVLPTREDIWGLVINEAMANGLPIITTNKCVAGVELINQNGRLINNEDYETLGKYINELLTDDDLLNNYSRMSLNNIKSYSIEEMALKIYKLLIGDK